MSKREPTVRKVDAHAAAHTWNELLDDVVQSHDRIIVERGGKPVAAVISTADLERLRRFEAQLHRHFDVLDRMAEAFKDVPFEEIEREAAKAIEEVRAEMRAEREARSEAGST